MSSFHIAKTLRLLEQFFWWIGMSMCTRWWLRRCFKRQARLTWPIHPISLPSGLGVAINVDYYGPLPTAPRSNAYILIFSDRFSRRADMYAVADAELTAEGTPTVWLLCLPLWSYPASILSGNGLQSCSKCSVVILIRLCVRQITTSTYHPIGNGGVEGQPCDGSDVVHSD